LLILTLFALETIFLLVTYRDSMFWNLLEYVRFNRRRLRHSVSGSVGFHQNRLGRDADGWNKQFCSLTVCVSTLQPKGAVTLSTYGYHRLWNSDRNALPADGAIDEEALKALVNWQIASGIDFLVACGSTGEAATLDEDEWLRTVSIVVEAAGGRVPVWAGCTTTRPARWCARQASSSRYAPGRGAFGHPYYNKPSQEGQFSTFWLWRRRWTRFPWRSTTCPDARR